jgi:hypothetical protein
VKFIAVGLGLVIAAICAIIVAAPSVSLEFGRSLISQNVLYVAAAVRIFFGAVLLWVAPGARAPNSLRILGAVILIAGLVTPFVGVERSLTIFDWMIAQGPLFTRAWAGVALALGLFIAYALIARRRSAS